MDAYVTESWHKSLRVSQVSTPLADEPAQMKGSGRIFSFITSPLNAKRAATFKTNCPFCWLNDESIRKIIIYNFNMLYKKHNLSIQANLVSVIF